MNPVLTKIVRTLDKPEYFFRPMQLLRRLRRQFEANDGRFETLTLPWGHDLEVRLNENVGFSIWHLGIYDLVLSEVIWRLLDPGEIAADIGANLGYVTSLMAARTGARGQVFAFEPHPALFGQLSANAARWTSSRDTGRVNLVQSAVSDKRGNGVLGVPDSFGSNSGLAFLVDEKNADSAVKTMPVSLRALDEMFENAPCPLVIKIDTEGNEIDVLKGASRLLREKKIRDIIFEDHVAYPSAPMTLLTNAGYTLFKIQKGFFGPSLVDASVSKGSAWEPPNYLATRDAARARARMADRGWRVLKEH